MYRCTNRESRREAKGVGRSRFRHSVRSYRLLPRLKRSNPLATSFKDIFRLRCDAVPRFFGEMRQQRDDVHVQNLVTSRCATISSNFRFNGWALLFLRPFHLHYRHNVKSYAIPNQLQSNYQDAATMIVSLTRRSPTSSSPSAHSES